MLAMLQNTKLQCQPAGVNVENWPQAAGHTVTMVLT